VLADHPSNLTQFAPSVAETLSMLDATSIPGSFAWPTYVSYDRYGNKILRPRHLIKGPLPG
jgi:hypothetical protein